MQKERFLSLDVMRGLTLALMILVNTPGSWQFVYGPLLHADWHGATPTDYIFPFFMFIVGSAMVFAMRGLSKLTPSQQTLKILRRVGLLFLIGVLLLAYPFNKSIDEWRVMGVLQRIALAYGAAAFIILYCGVWTRALIAAGLLIGYWGLLNLVANPYGLETNVVRHIDLAVLGAEHLWQGKGIAFDPEGLLSTLPSIVNVLIGYEATRILISSDNKSRAMLQLLALGFGMIILALLWNVSFPINKSLWTSPFVLITCGSAIIMLLLLVAIERSPLMRVVAPAYRFFEIIGKNPLFIYVLSGLIAITLYWIPVSGTHAYAALYNLYCTFADPYFASFLFALTMVALLWLIAFVLHKRNIVISL